MSRNQEMGKDRSGGKGWWARGKEQCDSQPQGTVESAGVERVSAGSLRPTELLRLMQQGVRRHCKFKNTWDGWKTKRQVSLS